IKWQLRGGLERGGGKEISRRARFTRGRPHSVSRSGSMKSRRRRGVVDVVQRRRNLIVGIVVLVIDPRLRERENGCQQECDRLPPHREKGKTRMKRGGNGEGRGERRGERGMEEREKRAES
ncbi:hypothetical protein PMAYCL1PPCAC_01698, partial [Pristionchus mayeri]